MARQHMGGTVIGNMHDQAWPSLSVTLETAPEHPWLSPSVLRVCRRRSVSSAVCSPGTQRAECRDRGAYGGSSPAPRPRHLGLLYCEAPFPVSGHILISVPNIPPNVPEAIWPFLALTSGYILNFEVAGIACHM